MRTDTLIATLILPVASVVHNADAAIIAFTQRPVWELFTTNNGASRSSETFDSYSGLYQPALSGSAGGVNWTAAASGGLDVRAAAGTQSLSTATPGELLIDFSGAPIQGLAANVFGTDASRSVIPIVVRLTLSDGTSIVRTAASATSFVGFWSTGSSITSIRIRPELSGDSLTSAFVNVDDLTFAAIPAPGPVALLAVAGLAARRRRS